LYCDGSIKWLTALAEMLSSKLLSTVAAGITHVVLHDLMEIASGEPFQRPNFFDEIQTKSHKSFPPCYSKSPLCLVIFFLQTHATSYIFFSAFLNTVKEIGGNLKENYTPFPMIKKSKQKPHVWRTLKNIPRNLKEIVRS
jgi:hypothetical protein